MVPYINIRTSALLALELNLSEYAICQIISYRCGNKRYSQNGWTKISYDELGGNIGLKKRQAINIVKSCIRKGLLELNPKNKHQKRTTLKFDLNVSEPEGQRVQKLHSKGGAKIAPQKVQKLHPEGVQKLHPTLYKVNNLNNLKVIREKNNIEKEDIPLSKSVQSFEKNTPQIPPPPPKKNPLETAKEIYENARAKFMKRKGATPDKFVWSRIETSNLEKLATALKMKKQDSEDWTDEYEFLEIVLKPFLEMAAEVDIWWNKTFSLYEMQIKFNSFFDELNINHGKSHSTTGKTKHLISDESVKRVHDKLLEKYRNQGWGDESGSTMVDGMSKAAY